VVKYVYRDEEKNPLYRVVRKAGKKFFQQRWTGRGWENGLDGTRRVLYRLPALLEADAEDPVFIVEGEKDADNLSELGLVATTNPGGAGKWNVVREADGALAGRDCVIIPDNDEPGRQHARDVAHHLHGKASSVRILNLPALPDKGDVSDWLEKGGSADQLLQLAMNTAEWQRTSVGPGDPEGELGWEPPIPFQPEHGPPVPTEVLPPWLHRFVSTVSEFTQTPSDMCLLLTLAACGCALAKKGVVQVRPGYIEPLILWTVAVLPPANRKSAVFKHVTSPIADYEQALAKKARSQLEISVARRRSLEKELKVALEAVVSSDGREQLSHMGDVEAIREEIEALPAETLPRLIAADVTTERLVQLMAENVGRMAVLSSEGDIFKLMAGRYSKTGATNFESYKKGWTGNEPIRDDRITREGSHVPDPALTLGLTVQPSVLANLPHGDQFIGEGLLGRFWYAVPPSPVGQRKTGSQVPPLDREAVEQYRAGLRLLLEAKPKAQDAHGEWVPNVLHLSDGARVLQNELDAIVETMLDPDEGILGPIADWGGKLVGQTVRVAGLLHLAFQVERVFAGDLPAGCMWDEPVSYTAMRGAVQIAEQLVDHALVAYALIRNGPPDHGVRLAKYVWKRICEAPSNDSLTKRDVHRLTQGHREINNVWDLDVALQKLEQHGYIRQVRELSHRPGRPSSPRILVNPLALGKG